MLALEKQLNKCISVAGDHAEGDKIWCDLVCLTVPGYRHFERPVYLLLMITATVYSCSCFYFLCCTHCTIFNNINNVFFSLAATCTELKSSAGWAHNVSPNCLLAQAISSPNACPSASAMTHFLSHCVMQPTLSFPWLHCCCTDCLASRLMSGRRLLEKVKFWHSVRHNNFVFRFINIQWLCKAVRCHYQGSIENTSYHKLQVSVSICCCCCYHLLFSLTNLLWS